MAEFLLMQGFLLTHQRVRHWEEGFSPLFAGLSRAKPKHRIGQVWFVDET